MVGFIKEWKVMSLLNKLNCNPYDMKNHNKN